MGRSHKAEDGIDELIHAALYMYGMHRVQLINCVHRSFHVKSEYVRL